MKTIYLATNNHYKLEEVREIARPFKIEIEGYPCDIRELQTLNTTQLIRHKILEAFKLLGLPVIVDHASLQIDSMNGMPGTLTQLFWDNLNYKLCDIVNALGNPKAKAVCTVGYCDGKKIFHEEKIKEGTISGRPLGKRDFQWDTIFIPDGETRTYAEMEISEKNAISQRKLAFESLFEKLNL